MFLKKRKETIKFKMRTKHVSQKKLATILNFSESYITRLIDGTRYSRKFEIYIARELGVNYRMLF